jgi:hypothetical protein
MNLKLISWLLKHRELLVAVIAAAKQFDKDGPYISQWEVVDKIARLVIPVVEREAQGVSPLLAHEVWESDEVTAFALGAEVHALGVDWQVLVQIVLPILIAILRALSPDE